MDKFHRGAILSRILAVTITTLFIYTNAHAEIDPPGRVARLSYVIGNLSFSTSGDDQWSDVNINRPLTAGDSLWVPKQAKAELHVGSTALRLNAQSSISFLTLNDNVAQVKLTRGDLIVRLRNLPTDDSFEVDTPNLAFSPQEPGEYRIRVDEDDTTTVTVRKGTGIAYGDQDSVSIMESEQARFSGTNLSELLIGNAPSYDTFDAWALERDRAEDSSVSARYVSREVIGYEQLDQYGTWETNSDYGAVWYPRNVDAGWAPYRTGNWSWIAPWGWTWVDNAAWGFAPYHYGRWAHVGSRWAWVPGQNLRHTRAIYAPALVAFIGGNGVNASLNLNFGHSNSNAIAWFPLGPGEAYHPYYRSSPNYIEHLNNGFDNRHADRDRDHGDRYVNQRIKDAVSAMPAHDFGDYRNNAKVIKPMRPKDISNSQVTDGAPAAMPPTHNRPEQYGRHSANPDNERMMDRAVVTTPQSNQTDRDRSNRFENNSRLGYDGNRAQQSNPVNTMPQANSQNGNEREGKRSNDFDRFHGQANPNQGTATMQGDRTRIAPVGPSSALINNQITPTPQAQLDNNERARRGYPSQNAATDSGNNANRINNGRDNRYGNNDSNRYDDRSVNPRGADHPPSTPPPASVPMNTPPQVPVTVQQRAPIPRARLDNEENTRQALQNAFIEHQRASSNNARQSDNNRFSANPDNAVPMERRRDNTNNGEELQRQRMMERPVTNNREMNRPVPAQEPVVQPQRTERPVEIKKEPTAQPTQVKPEKDKGSHEHDGNRSDRRMER